MKLYLHIGYHKTGSSFIQMMLSKNRGDLREKGIYYPSAKRDKAAQKGQITPGNALVFSQAINQSGDDFQGAFDLLQNWMDDAKKNKCDSLLLSNEGLFHTLSAIDTQLFFQQAITKLKLENTAVLLFLRDPLDHIFSLYKHRGKRGTIPNFKDWVEQDYETLQVTDQFFVQIESDSQVDFSFRKYKSNSQHLAKAVFEDWLQIPTPAIPQKDRVNTSLSLSEIMVLENAHPILGRDKILKIQKRFRENPKPKPSEDHLKKHYADQVAGFLNSHRPLIEKINRLMPETENLSLESQKAEKSQCQFRSAKLSDKQLRLLIEQSSLQIPFKEKLIKKMKTVYRALKN